MWKDFKEFISRGNVIDLAIGVIIGTAFTAIVNSLVNDIFTPVIGVLLGGVDIEGLAFTFGEATINYGKFIMSVITFLLIALVLFFIIRGLAAANRELTERGIIEEEAAEEPAEPALTLEEQLLTEIRDLLKGNAAPGGQNGGNAAG